MVIAELSIVPLAGEDMRPAIEIAVDILKKSGLKYEVGALGTTIEGELEQVLQVLKQTHQAVMHQGPERVLTELRIDERRTGAASMEQEVAAFR